MRLTSYPAVSFLLVSILVSACAVVPRGSFSSEMLPPPDYSRETYWAALPTMKDSADAVPVAGWRDEQATAPVDVFFLHPTTYTRRAKRHAWNADVNDPPLNLKTDRTTIRYQASLFNGAGRIYAPRYRQAHLHCFFTKRNLSEAKAALDLAYEDTREAFQYYLRYFNQGRPFILAAHSQGTFHAARLLKEEIENTPLAQQLVVAYLPGMPVRAGYFHRIKPCAHPDETDCYCSWRTYRKGYLPKREHFPDEGVVVTNPVTWESTMPVAARDQQAGAVLRDFRTLMPHLLATEVHDDLLWVSKPRFPWSFLLLTKNYHIADYNFFYADVRQNARERIRAYLERH